MNKLDLLLNKLANKIQIVNGFLQTNRTKEELDAAQQDVCTAYYEVYSCIQEQKNVVNASKKEDSL